MSGIFAGFWLSDTRHLKPQIETLIAKQTGYTAQLVGDLGWQWQPPLQLHAGKVELRGKDDHIVIDRVALSVDIAALWRDIHSWRIEELSMTDLVRTSGTQTQRLSSIIIRELSWDRPAEFSLNGEFQTDVESEPTPVTAAGRVRYQPAKQDVAQQLVLNDVNITSPNVTAMCQVQVNLLTSVRPLTPSETTELIPTDALLRHGLLGDCLISRLAVNGHVFMNTHVTISNVDGQANVNLENTDFFGGQLSVDTTIDARQAPIAWTIRPELESVNSQPLLVWLNQRVEWVAPLTLTSLIKMSGNSRMELAQSIKADSRFNGEPGAISVSTFKDQLRRFMQPLGQSDALATWPDELQYEDFSGHWRIDGIEHQLEVALDHVSVSARGTYRYSDDELDMPLTLTIGEPAAGAYFSVDPVLQNTPIPFQCTGSRRSPSCKLQEDAIQQLITRALNPNDESGLRRKLEEKIEKSVPAEYQDAARGLLELLGRALRDD